MWRKYFLWLGCLAALYFAIASWLSFACRPVIVAPAGGGERHELMRPFIPFNSSFAMTSVDPWFGDVADSAGEEGQSSPIILYENDKPLEHAHTQNHSDISKLGRGRYSHWKANYSVFVFSSSDNTDPRTNGKTYWAVKPPQPPDSGIAPDVPGEKHRLQRPFKPLADSAFAVAARDKWFSDVADVAGPYLPNSPVVIYEDGKPLGPAHSTPHSDIGAFGHGRFSHWGSGSASILVFSSSDNTDPQTNGRSYWAVKPPPPPDSGIAPDVPGEMHHLQRPFAPLGRSAFAVEARDEWFSDVADVAGQFDSSSPVVIFEDGKPLGPAHSTPHSDIGTLGRGRFSHWENGGTSVLVFSSSDNTDPETNGRSYWAVLPPPPDSGIAPAIPGEKHHLKRPFARFDQSAFAAITKDKWFSDAADVAGQFDSSSPVVIYEDGKPLGPAHSTPHGTIGSLGLGRFSHWKNGDTSVLVFSSSDNTDPETNGRSYWAAKPKQ